MCLATALASGARAASDAPLTCTSIQTAVRLTDEQGCAASDRGWVFAPIPELVAAVGALDEAVSRFESAFGRAAPKVVLLLGDDPGPSLLQIIRDRGAVSAVWPSAAQTRTLVRQALKAQLASLGGANSPEGEARLNAVLTRFDAQQPTSPSAVEVGTYQHEIGHAVFAAVFYRNAAPADGYGTPAPDWLDEAAAIVVENQALNEARRARYSARDSAVCRPLASLFSTRHPQSSTGGVRGTVTVRVAVGPPTSEQGKEVSETAAFYMRVRAFLDYLESVRPRVFPAFADAVSGGMDVEMALRRVRDETGDGPGAIAQLQAEYEQWLATNRYCSDASSG